MIKNTPMKQIFDLNKIVEYSHIKNMAIKSQILIYLLYLYTNVSQEPII